MAWPGSACLLLSFYLFPKWHPARDSDKMFCDYSKVWQTKEEAKLYFPSDELNSAPVGRNASEDSVRPRPIHISSSKWPLKFWWIPPSLAASFKHYWNTLMLFGHAIFYCLELAHVRWIFQATLLVSLNLLFGYVNHWKTEVVYFS